MAEEIDLRKIGELMKPHDPEHRQYILQNLRRGVRQQLGEEFVYGCGPVASVPGFLLPEVRRIDGARDEVNRGAKKAWRADKTDSSDALIIMDELIKELAESLRKLAKEDGRRLYFFEASAEVARERSELSMLVWAEIVSVPSVNIKEA